MDGIRSVAVRTGIAGGVVFLLHALIPNSRSYPFIWPVLTGAAAFWIATKDDAPHRIPRGMLTALVAGLIVGLIGFVGSTLVVLALTLTALRPILESLGVGGPVLVTAAAVVAIAAINGVAIGATLIGGIVMIPVRLVQAWRTSAPATR
jgi:hypothetical protein